MLNKDLTLSIGRKIHCSYFEVILIGSASSGTRYIMVQIQVLETFKCILWFFLLLCQNVFIVRYNYDRTRLLCCQNLLAAFIMISKLKQSFHLTSIRFFLMQNTTLRGSYEFHKVRILIEMKFIISKLLPIFDLSFPFGRGMICRVSFIPIN